MASLSKMARVPIRTLVTSAMFVIDGGGIGVDANGILKTAVPSGYGLSGAYFPRVTLLEWLSGLS